MKIHLLISLHFWVFFSTSLLGQNYERYKKLLDTTFTSKYLGYNKEFTITVPIEWEKNTKRDYPLIMVFDKQNQRSHQYILNTIDYLTSNEQIPSCLVVSLESKQDYRYFETLHKVSDEKGLAIENEKFIFEELIPLLEKKFHASSFRVFVGHSRYGYFTSSLLFSRLNQLNGVIAISPFFEQKKVSLIDSINTLNNKKLPFKKFYRFGIGSDYPDDFKAMEAVIKKSNSLPLDAKGFLFKEADHNTTPGLTIGVSLYEIFEEWSKIQSKYIANEFKELKMIDSLEREIVAVYGSKLAFSLGILNGKGWYFYNEGLYEKSIEAWEILLKSYPNFSEAYLYLLEAQKKLKLEKKYSETIARFTTSIQNSNFYSETEKTELKQELQKMVN